MEGHTRAKSKRAPRELVCVSSHLDSQISQVLQANPTILTGKPRNRKARAGAPGHMTCLSLSFSLPGSPVPKLRRPVSRQLACDHNYHTLSLSPATLQVLGSRLGPRPSFHLSRKMRKVQGLHVNPKHKQEGKGQPPSPKAASVCQELSRFPQEADQPGQLGIGWVLAINLPLWPKTELSW